MNRTPAPGTVQVQLTGHGRDLIKVAAFLESVTRGGDPAAALEALQLDGIEITSERASTGDGQRITLYPAAQGDGPVTTTAAALVRRPAAGRASGP